MSDVGSAWVEISEKVLRDTLKAPAGCRIVDATADAWKGTVKLLFVSPDLPVPLECAPSAPVTIRQVGPVDAPEYVWSWNA